MNEKDTEVLIDGESHKLDEGSIDTFFSADNGNNFGIGFDKILKTDLLSVYDLFEMNSKRNFKNLTSTILKSYNDIFLDKATKRINENLVIILDHILSVKSKLMLNSGTTSYDVFQDYLNTIIDSDNSLLLKTVNDFVDKNYALNLDEITNDTKAKKKKVNKELQFSDAHAKALIKISYLYRIMIPIISTYLLNNKNTFGENATNNVNMVDTEGDEPEFEETNSAIFAYLFEKVSKNPKALRNKLYKLTYSRVSRTSYSDKRFWARAKDNLITKETVTLDIYKKLLTNALPKLSIDSDKNMVSFFQSVINNQIDFLFQNKFKYKIATIDNNSEKYSTDDDDDNTEYERMEIQMTHADEGTFILRKSSVQDVVAVISNKLDVEVTDDEVKALMLVLNRNMIQERIASMIVLKYFDDHSAMKFLNFFQYTKIILCCKKYLEKAKYIYLPQILIANCERHKERVQISGKTIKPKIYSSKKYIQLFEDKYKYFDADVKKPLDAIIGTTYSSIFTDNTGKEIFDSTVKVGKIAEELIDLAYLV